LCRVLRARSGARSRCCCTRNEARCEIVVRVGENGVQQRRALVDAQGDLPEVVLLNLAVRPRHVIERVHALALDVERPAPTSRFESLERVAAQLAIVRDDRNARRGPSAAALRRSGTRCGPITDRRERGVEVLAVDEHECGVEAGRGEVERRARHVVPIATSAPSLQTRSTPSGPDATARTRAPIGFASWTEVPDPAARAVDHEDLPRREVELVVEVAQRRDAVGTAHAGPLQNEYSMLWRGPE
jgi:hypothetical protein